MADERVQPVAEGVRHPGEEPRVLVGVPDPPQLRSQRVGPRVVPQGDCQREREGDDDQQFTTASPAALRRHRCEVRGAV